MVRDIWAIAVDDDLLSDQTITWTNVDSMMVFCGTCFTKKIKEVFNNSTRKMSLKKSLMKLPPHLVGPTNQLTLMLLIVASGVWSIFIPRHFDSSMPVTKLINRVSDQHHPVTSCWTLWRGMICYHVYHVMAVSDLFLTHGWCSIDTWGRDKMAANSQTTFKIVFFYENWYILLKIRTRFAPMCPINTKSVLIQIMAWRRAGDKPYLNHYWPSNLGICASLDFDQSTYRISIRCALFIFLMARYWPILGIFHQVASLLLGRLLSQYLWMPPDEYGRVSSCYFQLRTSLLCTIVWQQVHTDGCQKY